MTRATFVQSTVWAVMFVVVALLIQLPAMAQEGCLDVIQVYSQGLVNNLLEDSATRNVTVYLPHEYGKKPDKRYPVVYLLHGYSGDNTLWTGEHVIKDLHIGAVADKLISAGEIQPMILVAPDCNNFFGGSWYTNSRVTGRWEDFVANDLIRHIDAKYRTIPNRKSRGIAGHSMGGHGAIKIAMKHPELFSILYGMSPAAINFEEILKPPFTANFIEAAKTKNKNALPAIQWRSRSLIALAAAIAPNPELEPGFGQLPLDANGDRVKSAWQKWLEQDLSTGMLTRYGENLRRYDAIAIDCGTDEDLLPSIQAFVNALEKADIEHTFEMFEGGHIDRVASQLEKKVLPLFSKTLKSDKEAAVPIQ